MKKKIKLEDLRPEKKNKSKSTNFVIVFIKKKKIINEESKKK